MNVKEIKDMIRLMNENNLIELEIERDGTKVKLRKSGAAEPPMVTIAQPIAPAAEPTTISRPAENSSGSAAVVKSLKEIASPMVGTFYRSPSPESPPFVDVGQTVEIGQVVCIIEAMKLMNEIKAEVRGKIAEVAVENAAPVEFGQTLFVIEPTS